MPAFTTAVDVCNRALQHCRMARIATLADQSPNATETNFVYDKVRDAELRRNVWRFAIRRSVLRAVDTTSVTWTPPAWDVTVAYALGAIVSYNGFYWQVDQSVTGGLTPDVATAWHRYFGPIVIDPLVAGQSYFAGELATSGGTTYLSLVSMNTDTPPTSNWLNVNGTTLPLQIVYPIGTGPLTNTLTANVFRLPYGFLRRAPQSPKQGVNPFLGAPCGLLDDDWLLEGNYIVSMDAGPVMLRYVADMIDVYDMDPMFCEGWAARIAKEAAPVLVTDKSLATILAKVEADYKRTMGEARTVNGIETGTEDPAEDDFVTCRV